MRTNSLIIVCLVFGLSPHTMKSQELKKETPFENFYEADGLRSEIIYTIHSEDSTIEISCNLNNISNQSIFFVGYSTEKGNTYNTYKDYFKIECGNYTKIITEENTNNKPGFYDSETIYVHLKYKSFLNTNHVLSQGWCFRSELKPGKAYGTKAILKVDPKGAKYIDVDIDFVYKPDGPEDWITDNDIKSHVYKISLSHE